MVLFKWLLQNRVNVNTSPFPLHADWQLGHTVANLSVQQRDWLLEPHSLTAKLKAHSSTFSVKVINEQKFILNEQQKKQLSCQYSYAINREVLLLCNGTPMVYAQSWLPISPVLQQRQLLNSGDKPLGETIFTHSNLKRTDIELAQFDSQKLQPYCPNTCFERSTLWGRRSIFSLFNEQFLVAEIFLPKAYLYL